MFIHHDSVTSAVVIMECTVCCHSGNNRLYYMHHSPGSQSRKIRYCNTSYVVRDSCNVVTNTENYV
jgi:hypothetical protein